MKAGQKRRDTTRIDALIKEFYPEKGPDYISELTGEPRAYIISRANLKRIKMNKKPGTRKEAVSKTEQIRILTERNKTLRLENIKLIENRRMYEKLQDITIY